MALMFVFGFSTPLLAVLSEYSASANSLSGITSLSSSVADYTLSPVLNSTGIAATWHKPFNVSASTIYGLHTAFPVQKVIVASGINYLNHPDYRWQDEYLCIAFNLPYMVLGATQHLVYEKIGKESWFSWDNDAAIKVQGSNYGLELRYLRVWTDNAAFVVSALSRLSDSASVSTAYTWRRDGDGCYAFATNYQIVPAFILLSSWQSEPARVGIGAKFDTGKVSLLYGIRSHTELDLTHSIDLEVSW